MTWSYSGDPSNSTLDEVRFLSGCTDTTDQLIQDEEINYAIGEYPEPRLAAAYVLQSLAAKFSRMVSSTVGQVSSDCSDITKAFRARAKELDPGGVVLNKTLLVLPSFGGRKISEKETLASDTDAVQPFFYRNKDDIPGGPDDNEIAEWYWAQ